MPCVGTCGPYVSVGTLLLLSSFVPFGIFVLETPPPLSSWGQASPELEMSVFSPELLINQSTRDFSSGSSVWSSPCAS